MGTKGISIIIPTYNGGPIFPKCIEKINNQDYPGEIQLIVIDSGSSDGTIKLAKEAGALVIEIDKNEFSHARTRNKALAYTKYDNVVCFVQDAIPCSNTWLSDLERSLNEYDVSAVYIRQIPHQDADLYARFEVEYHSKYLGDKPVIQQIDSIESFREMNYRDALRIIRLDNVCAIYRKELLLKRPFPEVDFAEDMAWAYQNLLAGNRVLYQPNIKVRHSHNRSPEYRFRRAIVNSISCAKIMKRVEDDLSFFNIRDLLNLSKESYQYVNKLKAKIVRNGAEDWQKGEDRDSLINKVKKRYPLTRYAKVREKIKQSINNIKYVLDLIQKQYNVTHKEELIFALDQITSNVIGIKYGEVYSSYMLNGELTTKFEKFFEPYMCGV